MQKDILSDVIGKPLPVQMMIFLENCTTNINFSQDLLSSIILKLLSTSDKNIRDLIKSEDLDVQKLGSQLLFGEYLYIFNVALSLRHYDYECLHYPHNILQFISQRYGGTLFENSSSNNR